MAARSVDFPAFGSPYNKINLVFEQMNEQKTSRGQKVRKNQYKGGLCSPNKQMISYNKGEKKPTEALLHISMSSFTNFRPW